ncbi:protein YAE1-like protein [Senna tora]|uniref:Protein YAE1-like protein n=1 Tax=Senna tora TaxID=362788 RepID=A0A834TMN5_9FABA|nr:protein YAE1-like protein [Senna tora]
MYFEDEMENRFAEELYSESLQLSNLELTPSADNQQKNLNGKNLSGCVALLIWSLCYYALNVFDSGGYDLGEEAGSVWDDSDEELSKSSDLDREWQRRHDQFHTIGYRDGLIAGKEASAQEGFNIGFKQSVLAGYSWGLVRDELKEKLVETQERRNEFQGLHESVNSLSTTNALQLFNEDMKNKEASSDLQEQTSDCSQLGNYLGQLKSLIHESPAIQMHLPETELVSEIGFVTSFADHKDGNRGWIPFCFCLNTNKEKVSVISISVTLNKFHVGIKGRKFCCRGLIFLGSSSSLTGILCLIDPLEFVLVSCSSPPVQLLSFSSNNIADTSSKLFDKALFDSLSSSVKTAETTSSLCWELSILVSSREQLDSKFPNLSPWPAPVDVASSSFTLALTSIEKPISASACPGLLSMIICSISESSVSMGTCSLRRPSASLFLVFRNRASFAVTGNIWWLILTSCDGVIHLFSSICAVLLGMWQWLEHGEAVAFLVGKSFLLKVVIGEPSIQKTELTLNSFSSYQLPCLCHLGCEKAASGWPSA